MSKLRAYIEEQIRWRRDYERKLESFCQFGRVPRPRNGKPPTGAETAAAAARSGDIARERMFWESALQLLERGD